jgi:predicted Zn finger-like uncharacterized protein
MYSQCPKCQAIFSVSGSDIDAHRGLVRCGYCNSVFHAPTNEVDDARVQTGGEGAGESRGAVSSDDPLIEAAPETPAGVPETGGGANAYPEPGESEAEQPPAVREEPGWAAVAGGQAGRAPGSHDEVLIEPVLPDPRAPGEQVSDEPWRDDAPREEPVQEEPVREEPVREEPVREESVREESVREESVREESVREESVQEESVQEESVQEEPVQEEPVKEEPVQEEPVQEEPVQEEPVQEESVQEEPVQEEPVQEEPVQEEPVRAEPAETDSPADADTELPGEIIEEITIEAPPVLWNVFDDDLDEEGSRSESTRGDGSGGVDASRPASRSRTGERRQQVRPGQTAPSDEPETPAAPGRRSPLQSPYRERDIRMVELPKPRPFKTATLSLLTVLLALLMVWQVKTYYLSDLAQVTVLRPYLEWVCRPLGCVLPPRQDFARINLVGTSIDVNPERPGALEITASLINRAAFPQPYPPLRVTLTDREGRVVGRRTYLPSEYRGGQDGELLATSEVSDVAINLAQPSRNAVGYEVELMAPVLDGG